MNKATSFHGDVINATYQQLVDALGEPTYPDLSPDNKVQKEWQIEDNDNDLFFTIYDWKEYDNNITDGNKYEWHIGHDGHSDTINKLTEYLNERNLIVVKEKMF